MGNITLKGFFVILVLSIILTACTTGAPTSPLTEAPAQMPPTGEPTTPPEPVATEESVPPPEPAETLEPFKLKVLVLPYQAYAPFFIAKEEGYYAEQGLDVEFVRMEKSGEFTPALAQGQLDVAADLLNVGTLNAIAKGSQIKYVADKGFFDPESCTYTAWMARKDLLESGVLDDLKNLAGMKIAASSATTIEYFFDTMVKDVGLSSADAEFMNLPPADRLEALKTGAIDITNVAEPWILRIKNAGAGDVWRPIEKEFPNFAFSILMFGPNLLEKNPEVGKRFMIAYLKAIQKYNEGKTDRNIEIISKYTEQTPEELMQMCWQSIVPDGKLNLQSVLDFQEWAVAKGYVDAALTEEQLWDPSFIEYANEALK